MPQGFCPWRVLAQHEWASSNDKASRIAGDWVFWPKDRQWAFGGCCLVERLNNRPRKSWFHEGVQVHDDKPAHIGLWNAQVLDPLPSVVAYRSKAPWQII